VHQAFVASRTASPWDSLLDSVGAFAASLVLFVWYRNDRTNSARRESADAVSSAD